jgi:LysM repeat protein
MRGNKESVMRKRILLLACFVFLLPLGALADYDRLGCGARPFALGGYTAYSDDVYGIYYNPGGLSWVKYPEVSIDYANLWYGLTDNSSLGDGFFGYVRPSKSQKSAVGLAWHNFSLMGYYTENNLIMSYSNRFTDNFGLGISVKPFYQTYNMDSYTDLDPVFNYGSKTSGTAFGLDLGLLWNFSPDYFLGFSMLNMNLFESISNIGFSEIQILPSTINLGLAYRRYYLQDNLFNAGLDLEYSESDIKLHAGMERWFSKKKYALRGGIGFGARQYYSVSLGLGLRFKLADVDYAFSLPAGSINGTFGTHRISFKYRFTPLDVAMRPVSMEEYEKEREDLQSKILELQIKLRDAKTAAPQDRTQEVEELNKQIYELKNELQGAKKELGEQKRRPVEQPAAPREEAPKKPAVTRHTVQAGESLPSIAQKYYGDTSQWKKIYDANKDKIERGQVTPGQVLVIP